MNTETAVDKRLQAGAVAGCGLAARARDEITQAAAVLDNDGVAMHLFEEEGTQTPDAVFRNSWFSTHAGGPFKLRADGLRCARRRRGAHLSHQCADVRRHQFALIGLDMLTDAVRRWKIAERLYRSGRRIIPLSNGTIEIRDQAS